MLIKIRNVTYDSVRHAADSLGVTKDAVYSALQRGSMEMVGLGDNQSAPINLNGLQFASMSAASVALGFNRSFVRYVTGGGSQKSIERLQAAIKRYKQDHGVTQ